MAFGERLQEVRKRSGLTQEEFAEQLQVSRQSVSRWESGRGYPEMEKIIFICNRYGVTMDGLFKEEVPTPGEPPVEAPLLSARTLGSELSNLYANLSPYNKSIGIMLLTVIAMIGPAYVYCMRSLKGGADEMMTIIWIAAIIIFGIAEAASGAERRLRNHDGTRHSEISDLLFGDPEKERQDGAGRGAVAAIRGLPDRIHSGAYRNKAPCAQDAG